MGLLSRRVDLDAGLFAIADRIKVALVSDGRVFEETNFVLTLATVSYCLHLATGSRMQLVLIERTVQLFIRVDSLVL